MTTLPQITLASRSMRELSPCCPFSPFLSLATWKSGAFRGSKKAGAEWREATASALQQIPGLEILTGKSQRLDQSQHGDDISETTRNEWFFYYRKRGTLVHNKEVICCMSVVKLKRNWCNYNELMHDVQYSVLLTTIATNDRCPMQDQQGLIQSLSSYIPCLQEKCWRHASEIWCTL